MHRVVLLACFWRMHACRVVDGCRLQSTRRDRTQCLVWSEFLQYVRHHVQILNISHGSSCAKAARVLIQLPAETVTVCLPCLSCKCFSSARDSALQLGSELKCQRAAGMPNDTFIPFFSFSLLHRTFQLHAIRANKHHGHSASSTSPEPAVPSPSTSASPLAAPPLISLLQ
jgi:hypothetical protein